MKKFLVGLFSILMIIGLGTVASSTELITNGDFSNGLTGWEYSGTVTTSSSSLSNMVGTYALLGANTSSGTSSLWQDFVVSPSYTTITISFNYAISYMDNDYDTGWWDDDENDTFLSIVTDNGIMWAFDEEDLYTYSTTNGSGLISGTYSETINVANWVGFLDGLDLTETIKFSLLEDFSKLTNTSVGIDNVSINDGANSSAPVPEPATMLLLGSGLVGLGSLRRKFFKK